MEGHSKVTVAFRLHFWIREKIQGHKIFVVTQEPCKRHLGTCQQISGVGKSGCRFPHSGQASKGTVAYFGGLAACGKMQQDNVLGIVGEWPRAKLWGLDVSFLRLTWFTNVHKIAEKDNIIIFCLSESSLLTVSFTLAQMSGGFEHCSSDVHIFFRSASRSFLQHLTAFNE